MTCGYYVGLGRYRTFSLSQKVVLLNSTDVNSVVCSIDSHSLDLADVSSFLVSS